MIPAPTRTRPAMSSVRRSGDMAVKITGAEADSQGTRPMRSGPWADQPSTVTRVPSGVNGKTTLALAGGISTQPSLWGEP